MVLSRSFYLRSDVVVMARELLGKVLVSEIGGIITAGKIVETEAYRAPDDRGSHAFNNKKTSRTETMFRSGGIAYVYLCYGIHHMFNVVSAPEGIAHAVLIRAVEPLRGLEAMRLRRSSGIRDFELTNGPGKFTQAMGIQTSNDGTALFDSKGAIRIETNGSTILNKDIVPGPRVGIAYAGECALRPWRFRIKNNPWTSKPHEVKYAPDY